MKSVKHLKLLLLLLVVLPSFCLGQYENNEYKLLAYGKKYKSCCVIEYTDYVVLETYIIDKPGRFLLIDTLLKVNDSTFTGKNTSNKMLIYNGQKKLHRMLYDSSNTIVFDLKEASVKQTSDWEHKKKWDYYFKLEKEVIKNKKSHVRNTCLDSLRNKINETKYSDFLNELQLTRNCINKQNE